MVLFTLLRARKHHFEKTPCYSFTIKHSRRYTMDYWLLSFYSQDSEGEWIILIQFLFSWDGKPKGTLYAIFHWTMMIILFLSSFILKCHESLFFLPISNQWFLGILYHNYLGQSKNYIKFDLQYQSTATFKVSQSSLPKSKEHPTAEQYTGSPNCVEIDHKSDVHWQASGKLRKSTNVFSHCEQLS